MHRLDRLFRPRSVAVVGASPKGGYGLTTLHNLRGVGFTGSVYAVHPALSEVDDVAAYPDLRSLPDVPDAVAVAVPAATVPAVVAEAAELGVGGVVVYASGFAETDEAGRRRQADLVDVCGDRLPVIGPNCLGLASYRHRSALWGITLPHVHAGRDGRVALAAQSGNMALTTMLSGRLPSIAYGASLGNQAVTDVTDCLEYYLTDPAVRVIGLVVEGLRDLERFRRLALRAAEADVAVVVLKMGRSDKGGAAAVAHTGTLAGADGAYAALFRQTGVVRVDDLDELVTTCSLLAAPTRPAGRSLGIFASSGGECGLISDLAHDLAVDLPDPQPATERALEAVLPDYGHVSNPLDLTASGWGQTAVYATASHAFAEDPQVDVVALVGDWPTYSDGLADSGWPEMLAGAGKTATESDVPVALITTTTDTSAELARLCAANDVLLLAGLRPALRAVANAADRAVALRRTGRVPELEPTTVGRADEARGLIRGRAGALSETSSKQLLELYGVPVPEGMSARGVDGAVRAGVGLGFPVVCKVEADGLAHKSDIGAVVLDIRDADQLAGAAATVLAAGRDVAGDAVTGVRVERAVDTSRGVELIVGARNDAGTTTVVVGAGGILAELLGDAATLLWPFTAADVHLALDRLRVRRLLDAFRGLPPVDPGPLVDVVLRVGQLMADLPEIRELDLNPLLCRRDQAAAIALDALAVVASDDR